MPTSSRDFVLALALALPAFAGCDEEEEPVPIEVSDFHVHACNSANVTRELMTGRDASDYLGLQCVAWHFGSRRTAIDLINQPAGCGWDDSGEDRTLWTPSVDKLASGALRYRVEWGFEHPNACGACVHDFSVELGGLTHDGPLELELGVRDCTGDCDWVEDSVHLPLGEVDAGIACKYFPWRKFEIDERDRGKLHAPPRAGTCDGSLVASEDDALCLAPCDTDADCPLPELLSCSAGLCRLSQPW